MAPLGGALLEPLLSRPPWPCSVYSGHRSVLVPPLELESNVSLWLSAVSQYKARVTFCSYSVMEMCTKGLGAQTGVLRVSAPAACWPASLLWSARSQIRSKLGRWRLKKRLSPAPSSFPCVGSGRLRVPSSCGRGRGAKLKGAGALWDPRAPISSACVCLRVPKDLGGSAGGWAVWTWNNSTCVHTGGGGGGGTWVQARLCAQGGPRCPRR